MKIGLLRQLADLRKIRTDRHTIRPELFGHVDHRLQAYHWHTMLHLQLYFQGHTGETSVPGVLCYIVTAPEAVTVSVTLSVTILMHISPDLIWYCYQVLGNENVAGGQLATINTKI